MSGALHAADAARLLVDTSERGGTAAALLVVGGAEIRTLGQRLAVTRTDRGAPLVTHGSLGSPEFDEAARRLLADILAEPRAGDGLRSLTAADVTLEVHVEVRRPVQDLIVVGAGHIAQPMAHVGAMLGYRVTVLDDRPDFATRERFPEADRVLRADFNDPFADVPLHERSHILLVTRGHKYDYDCLVRALRADPPPAYIGMIGSRRRVRATYVQLRNEGFGREALGVIHAPVGLDIGAETPEEIAVAVAAELVMLHRRGTGRPLKDVERIVDRFMAEEEPA